MHTDTDTVARLRGELAHTHSMLAHMRAERTTLVRRLAACERLLGAWMDGGDGADKDWAILDEDDTHEAAMQHASPSRRPEPRVIPGRAAAIGVAIALGLVVAFVLTGMWGWLPTMGRTWGMAGALLLIGVGLAGAASGKALEVGRKGGVCR